MDKFSAAMGVEYYREVSTNNQEQFIHSSNNVKYQKHLHTLLWSKTIVNWCITELVGFDGLTRTTVLQF